MLVTLSIFLPSLHRHLLLSTRPSMQIATHAHEHTHAHATRQVASLVGSSDANTIPSAPGAAGSSRADAGAPPVASFAGAGGTPVAVCTSADASLMV
jgi:hypothetical protein